MTALEVLLVLILAGVVIVLLYSYMQNDRTLNIRRVRSDATNLGGRVYGEASNLGERVHGEATNLGERVSGEDSISEKSEKSNFSGVSERFSEVNKRFSEVSEKINVSGVSEKVSGVGESISGMGEKIKGKASGSTSTDDIYDSIDLYLNEKSDQLIKDWKLATKDDISDLENRFINVSKDLNKYKGQTNEKLKKIGDRLDKLENLEE
jgi:archaellum component FlaC